MQFDPTLRKTFWKNSQECAAQYGGIACFALQNFTRYHAMWRKIEVDRLALLPIGRSLQNCRATQAPVGNQHLFAKRLAVCTCNHVCRDSRQIAILFSLPRSE